MAARNGNDRASLCAPFLVSTSCGLASKAKLRLGTTEVGTPTHGLYLNLTPFSPSTSAICRRIPGGKAKLHDHENDCRLMMYRTHQFFFVFRLNCRVERLIHSPSAAEISVNCAASSASCVCNSARSPIMAAAGCAALAVSWRVSP